MRPNKESDQLKRENITVRGWMARATPDQKKELARFAKTSVMHLHHIAKGRRQIAPELAQRLAHASTKVLGIEPMDQRMLCAVCAQCQYTRGIYP
jgi:hypothetical protein